MFIISGLSTPEMAIRFLLSAEQNKWEKGFIKITSSLHNFILLMLLECRLFEKARFLARCFFDIVGYSSVFK